MGSLSVAGAQSTIGLKPKTLFAEDETCWRNRRAVLECATSVFKIHRRIASDSWFSLCFGLCETAMLKLIHTRDLAARMEGLAAGRLQGIT